jgi:uracil-DNA glycosylase
MAEKSASSAAEFIPERVDLAGLREAAAGCRGCGLYENATQTVFGEGPRDARVVLVGEQPGDQEDRQGRPFVGPAGRVLEQALADAGIAKEHTYITNAVKHFKWEPRGKRRIHKKPQDREIDACQPWLAAELEAIAPQALVCMGVTAARAAFGKAVRLKDYRGRFHESPLARATFVTTHPSALLRLVDRSQYAEEYERFVADLREVAQRLR